jgi:Cdc6-like AAA superfamily ATPase
MFSWLSEPSSSSSSMSIFWLAGLAGTGKSTIIKTFCQRVSSNNDFLLASFFASRNSSERRDPYRIVHTFAHQLAITSDDIRPHVLSAMRAPQDVMQELMLEQIKQLLAGPIEKAQLRGRTIVLAIDALDECQKSADGVEGGPLIELLAQVLQRQPVKLLVTSRQEDSITNMFHSLSHVPLRLHEIASAIVEADRYPADFRCRVHRDTAEARSRPRNRPMANSVTTGHARASDGTSLHLCGNAAQVC